MDFIEDHQVLLKGKRLTIVHCGDAEESFHKAINSVPNKKAGLMERQLMQQMLKLANGDSLSKENFPVEGDLPDKKNFYAFKKIPIRAYCWFSSSCRNTLFISHYVHKKKNILDKNDSANVKRNWNKKEKRNES